MGEGLQMAHAARKQAIRRAHEVLTYLQLEDARYRRLEEYSTGNAPKCASTPSGSARWGRPT